MTLTLNWVDRTIENGQVFFKKSEESEITFTILDNIIILNNSTSDHIIGVCYQYQGEEYFDGEGDWDTQWELHEGFVPASTELVTPPEDMATETWYLDATGPYGQLYAENVGLGFSGNEVYIRGIFSSFPDSWIKGSLDGNTITFESFQYQGKSYDSTIPRTS